MEEFTWYLYKAENPNFPYRITIKNGERIIVDLRTKDKWPGPKGNIFCLRQNPDIQEDFTEIEKVPILSLKRYGKKLIVVLERNVNKRCEFLFLKKKYKNKEGEYEQIFWRTQKGLTERGRNFKLYIPQKAKNIKILIDKKERYGWSFKCETKKVNLPVGDYALETEKGVIAIIERKTFNNFVSEIANLQIFLQKLAELSKYKYAAVVIEANYSDFLKKTEYYSPTFFSRAIGNIQAVYPSLPIVFAGSRKYAQNWVINYFQFVSMIEADTPLFTELEDKEKKLTKLSISLEEKILSLAPVEFFIDDLKAILPNYSKMVLRKALKNLEMENKVSVSKKKNKLYFKKIMEEGKC
jgi:ERCC4-type nuclease